MLPSRRQGYLLTPRYFRYFEYFLFHPFYCSIHILLRIHRNVFLSNPVTIDNFATYKSTRPIRHVSMSRGFNRSRGGREGGRMSERVHPHFFSLVKAVIGDYFHDFVETPFSESSPFDASLRSCRTSLFAVHHPAWFPIFPQLFLSFPGGEPRAAGKILTCRDRRNSNSVSHHV